MLWQLSLLLAGPACLLLVACQAYDPRGGYYAHALTPGAELQIINSIDVPAGLARVYLQHGQTMGYAVLDQYAPFCYFLMREPLPVRQTILAGLLRVESVSVKETEVRRASPYKLAALRLVGD